MKHGNMRNQGLEYFIKALRDFGILFLAISVPIIIVVIITTVIDSAETPIGIFKTRVLMDEEYWLQNVEVIEQYRVSDEDIFVYLKVSAEKAQEMTTKNVQKACDDAYAYLYKGYVCSNPIWYEPDENYWLREKYDISGGNLWCTASWYDNGFGLLNYRSALCVNTETGELWYE